MGQLLGSDRLTGCGSLTIEAHEILDAQVIDIGIVSYSLAGEMLAEIVSVGSDDMSKLREGEIVL